MKKKKWKIFKYHNEPGQFYLGSSHDFETYKEFHKDNVKVVKEFDDLNKALKFKDAMNLL